jgi:hypothetical protein
MGTFDAARAGRWDDWSGVPAGLSAGDAEAELGRTAVVHRRAGIAVHELTGGIRLWVRDGAVELVEIDDPDGDPTVIDELGPVDVEEPARFVVFGAATTEHVWLARGLALVTAAAYDHGLPGPPVDTAPHLVHAELFVPTDMDRWRQGPGRWRWQPRPHLH